MVTGAVIWFLWTAFFHAAEAKPLGICQAIFGKVTLLGSQCTAADPPVIALPILLGVMFLMQWQSVRQQHHYLPQNFLVKGFFPSDQEKLFLSSETSDNHGARAEQMHHLPGGIATRNQKGDHGSSGTGTRLVA